jgi:hypothetical protein
MKKFFLVLAAGCLAACQPGTTGVGSVSSIPGVQQVCSTINANSFDTALKAYDAARAAVNSLIDFKVLVPGTPTALRVASANDKVLAGFAAAEKARQLCNAPSYLAALNSARSAIAEIRAALPTRN